MKIVLVFLLSVVLQKVWAQQLDSAKSMLKTNRLSEAKKEIDALLQLNPENAEAYYTKAGIYNAIALHRSLSTQIPGARMEAFLALKKYTEIDETKGLSLQHDGFKPINDIYTGFYQDAANSFNTKDYNASLQGFANTIMVSSFMTEKGWINLKLDTNSVLYAGVSAEKLNHLDKASEYYGMLVDGRAKGESFVEIYKWLTNQYYMNKNSARQNITWRRARKCIPMIRFGPAWRLI